MFINFGHFFYFRIILIHNCKVIFFVNIEKWKYHNIKLSDRKKIPFFFFNTSYAYEVIDEDSTFYSTETKRYTHTHTQKTLMKSSTLIK